MASSVNPVGVDRLSRIHVPTSAAIRTHHVRGHGENESNPRSMFPSGVAAPTEMPPNYGPDGPTDDSTTENILHVGGRFDHASVRSLRKRLSNSDLLNDEGKHEEGDEATTSGPGSLSLVEIFTPTSPKDRESRRSKASTRTDLTTVTTCCDGGPGYEGAYVAEKADSLQPYPVPLGRQRAVATIYSHLVRAKVKSAYQDQEKYFISCIRFYSIMTEETVLCVLRELNSLRDRKLWLDERQLASLVARIAPPVSDLSDEEISCTQFRRVLASLILTRKEGCIFDFVKHGFNDRELCKAEFSVPEQDMDDMVDDHDYFRGFFEGYPTPCQDQEVWSIEDIRTLRRVRWEVSPVFFDIERRGTPESTSVRYKIVHYELRSAEQTLPFGRTNIVPNTDGAFSSFEFYTINPHQQNFYRYTKKGKAHPIAIKKLEDKKNPKPRDFSKMFNNERYILDRLTLLNQSPHVVKLLATFETVGQNAPNKYHFIFEAADGTILTLWESKSLWARIKAMSPAQRIGVARWVARQCQGLAEGLAHFHKFPKLQGDPNPRTNGMHGDIKPDNILWYKDWIPGNSGPLSVPTMENPDLSDEDDLGILQLADFGLSSFHSTGTVHDITFSSDTLDYTAPETECWLGHPPPSDVWQLGCLFLDFVTWLVRGPEGYKRFRDWRRSQGLLMNSRARFSTFQEHREIVRISRRSREAKPMEETTVHVSVSAKVLEHAMDLYNSKGSSPFVRDVIDLVINRMLVVELAHCLNRHQYPKETKETCRISSRVASEILGGMLKMEQRNPRYFQPSSVEKPVKYKKEPIVIKTTLDQMKMDVIGRKQESELESDAHH